MSGKATKRSRHQQVKDQDELIKKLLDAWRGHLGTTDPKQVTLNHAEIDESLGKLARSIQSTYEEVTEDISVVEQRVLFNEQPFWKRWYQRWQLFRATPRDTQILEPKEPLITEEIKDEEEERIFGKLAEKAREAQRTINKGEGEHNEPN